MTYSRAALALVATMLLSSVSSAADQALVPFKSLPKRPTSELVMPADSNGELIVKFDNDMKARVAPDGRFRALTPRPIDDANVILAQFGMTAFRVFNQDDEFLADIERRAAERSGKAQPDLAGMIRVTGPKANLEAAAQALNELDTIEWIEFDREMYTGDESVDMSTQQRREIAAGMRTERATQTVAAVENRRTMGDVNDALSLDGGFGGETGQPLLVNGCCLENNSCIDTVDPVECALSGGIPLGIPCGADTFCGACCSATDACIDRTTNTVCMATGGTYGGDATTCENFCLPGACCLANGNCVADVTRSQCTAQGGIFQGDASTCDNIECDNECGASLQNCWDVPVAQFYTLPFCSNLDCCELVCELSPLCCDENGSWDVYCASTANLLCSPHVQNWDAVAMDRQLKCAVPPVFPDPACPTGADRCAAIFNSSCFQENNIGGCNQLVCCNTVCAIDPFCCETAWDPLCLALAGSTCPDPTAGSGGDFEPLQGYLTPQPYPNPLPGDLASYVPNFGGIPLNGYSGEGWSIYLAPEPFTDLNGDLYWQPGETFFDFGRDGIAGTFDAGEGNGYWDPPAGLRGLADQLLKEYHIDGLGLGNLTRGLTTKVAVISSGFYPNHVDINHVKVERGQTIIEIPEIANNSWGTACLSIINAKDNGAGVTGLAPDAEGWFFPLTSIEEGPREGTAWASVLAELDAGDVVVPAYYPAIIGNLNNSEFRWTVFRAASDLGLTVVVPAGDGCDNLNEVEDFGDSGSIVVGACSPGEPYYRLATSNFCTAPPQDNSRGNMVHVKAWGANVCAAGYGDLFIPTNGDPNQAYTLSFGTTGAAAAQVGGLVAGIQGLAKQFYGIPVSPESIRYTLGAPGIPPTLPAPFLFGGFTADGGGCGLDLDVDQGPHMVGVYPDARFTVAELLADNLGGFADAPLLVDVVVARGRNIEGNRFSVKGRDNVYLQYDAIPTRPGDGPLSDFGLGSGVGGGVAIPEANEVDYFIAGETTDIVFLGQANIDVINTLIIETELRYPNVFNIMIVELYDHRRERFSFVDLITDPSDAFDTEMDSGDLRFAHVAVSASRFIKQGRIVGRIWSVGFPNFTQLGGGGFGGDDGYRMQVDLINIFVSEEFGEGLP